MRATAPGCSTVMLPWVCAVSTAETGIGHKWPSDSDACPWSPRPMDTIPLGLQSRTEMRWCLGIPRAKNGWLKRENHLQKNGISQQSVIYFWAKKTESNSWSCFPVNLQFARYPWIGNLAQVGGDKQTQCFYKSTNIPYGSKHCLRRYLTLQIIVNYTPVPLPKKILGSYGIDSKLTN